jgi:hypothetical protein
LLPRVGTGLALFKIRRRAQANASNFWNSVLCLSDACYWH